MSCSFECKVSSWDINKYKINVLFSGVKLIRLHISWSSFPAHPDTKQWPSVLTDLPHNSTLWLWLTNSGMHLWSKLNHPGFSFSSLKFWHMSGSPHEWLYSRERWNPQSYPCSFSSHLWISWYSSIFPGKCPFKIGLPNSVFSYCNQKKIHCFLLKNHCSFCYNLKVQRKDFLKRPNEACICFLILSK